MEELITEAIDKGSITSGGPSRCGTPVGFFNYYMEICRLIYREDERILGKIIQEAKRRIIAQYYPDDALYGPAVVWTLLSDPALRIKYPIQSTNISDKIISKEKKYLLPIAGSHIIIPADGRVTVYSARGSMIIKENKVKQGSRIKLSNGVYFVRFVNNNDKIIQKVVIVKRGNN